MSDLAEYTTEFTPGSVKAAASAADAKSGDLWMVPLDNIAIPEGFNVRLHTRAYQARVEWVANSIMDNGFYRHMPLKGYAAKEGDHSLIYCVGGTTRLLAAKLARDCGHPIEAVPVVMVAPGTNMIDLQFGIGMDNTADSLKPYERGTLVKRILACGVDEKTISKRMGVTAGYIANLLYLHSLPQTLLQFVIDDRISAGHAVELVKAHGVEGSLQIIRDSLARQTEDDPPLTGDSDEAQSVDSGGAEGRIRPRHTRQANPGTLSKKIVLAAIDYSIALNDIEFLVRWRKGEPEALGEVEATLDKTADAEAKAKAKAAKAAERAKVKTEKAKAKAKKPRKAKGQKAAEAEIGKEADRQAKEDPEL